MEVETLDRFLASMERKSFCMAEFATNDADDAMMIVRETMIRWMQKYSDKPRPDWRLHFNLVLQDKIREYTGKPSGIGSLFRAFRKKTIARPVFDEMHNRRKSDAFNYSLHIALRKLSIREQQIFFLHCWQGFDFTQIGRIMHLSESESEKHYASASSTIRESLEQANV